MIIGYIRVSTDRQAADNQRYEILKFADEKKWTINEWVEETVGGAINVKERKLGSLLQKMQANDALVATELSRIGRSSMEIMSILHDCMERNIKVFTTKERYELGNNINSKVLAFAFGLSAEIERRLISQRTIEALARKKKEGKKLGRPKGSLAKVTKPIDTLPPIYANLPPSPPPSSFPAGPTNIGTKCSSASYYKALSTAAIKARNSAITKGLSESDTISLAQNAFDLEMTLCGINENIRTIADSKISFDAIRSPIFEQLEKNLHQVSVAQKVDLVKVEMVHPHQKFSAGQKITLNKLGLTDPSISVVQFDRPSLWAEVKKARTLLRQPNFRQNFQHFPPSRPNVDSQIC